MAEVGNRQLRLTWDASAYDAITQYQYRQKTTGEYGDWQAMAGSGSATASHTVTGLENGTEHTLQIRAVNGQGNGPASDGAKGTPQAVPLKPTRFRAAAAGNRLVGLTWADPNDATITGYQYRQKADQGAYGGWTNIPGSGASTSYYSLSNLTNGTAYTFRIRALNATGIGTASDEATATPYGPPARPTGLQAAAGHRQVRLSWTNPGNATITQYLYRQKAAGSYGSWQDIANSGAATTAHTVKSLVNGTAYTFQVRVRNLSGTSPTSAEASATPRTPLPAKTSGLTAEAGNTKAYLEWSDPSDESITGYQYRQKAAGSYGNWTNIANSGAATTAYTATGLTNSTLYMFQIRALNGSGSGAGVECGIGDAGGGAGSADGIHGDGRSQAGHAGMERPERHRDHRLRVPAEVGRPVRELDGDVGERVGDHQPYSDEPVRQHDIRVPDPGAERNRSERGHERGVGADGAGEAGRLRGRGAGPGRASVVVEPARCHDHRLPVPAEDEHLRELDEHCRERGVDDEPHGRQPDEQYGVHVPDPSAERDGQRHGLGRGLGDADSGAGEADGAERVDDASGRDAVVDEPLERKHHAVGVPAEGEQQPLRELDGHPEQHGDDDELRAGGPDEPDEVHIPDPGAERIGGGHGLGRIGGGSGFGSSAADRGHDRRGEPTGDAELERSVGHFDRALRV